MYQKFIIGSVLMQLIDDYHEMERHFFSLVSSNCFDYQTLVAFETGVPASGLNPVFVRHVSEQFVRDLAHCTSYFIQKNVPWALIVPEESLLNSKQHTQFIKEFTLADKGVGMAFNLLGNNWQSADSSLEFKMMNEDLHSWSIPLTHGFQSTPEITAIYILRHAEALKKCKGLYHVTGFLAGEPVVSLTLTVKEHLARIDDLATIPGYQKRGFASAIMAYALKRALELKVKTCFLEASKDGLNLYKRIGFQPLFTNLYYELQPETLTVESEIA